MNMVQQLVQWSMNFEEKAADETLENNLWELCWHVAVQSGIRLFAEQAEICNFRRIVKFIFKKKCCSMASLNASELHSLGSFHGAVTVILRL